MLVFASANLGNTLKKTYTADTAPAPPPDSDFVKKGKMREQKDRLSHFRPFFQESFASEDIGVGESKFGGPGGKGVFTRRALSYDREIMRVRSFVSYVSEEPVSEQALHCVRQTLEIMLASKEGWDYVDRYVMRLQNGTWFPFHTDDETCRFFEGFPTLKFELEKRGRGTEIASLLASKYEMCRWDVKYRDRLGIAIFPEASMFNHTCDANIELEIKTIGPDFVLIARTTRPIEAGEELFISYIKDDEVSVTHKQMQLRKRWGFECQCPECRTRSMSAALAVLLVVIAVTLPAHNAYYSNQNSKSQ